VGEKAKFAVGARRWFLARVAVASFLLIVPYLLGVTFAVRSHLGEGQAIAAERRSLATIRLLVGASTSLLLFRDALIAGAPVSHASIVSVEKGLRAFNMLVRDESRLANGADPSLRAKLHAVSSTLIPTLRVRSLSLKERIAAALLLSEVESSAVRIGAVYGIRLDLGERSVNAAERLLRGRERALNRRALFVGLTFIALAALLMRLHKLVIEDLRVGAGLISQQEIWQTELNVQRIAEQASVAKTAHLQTILEKVPVGIVTLDVIGSIVYANKWMSNFLQEDHLEHGKFNLIGTYKDELLELLNPPYKRNVLSFERSFTLASRKVVWADLTISRMDNAGSRLAVCMARDITERKEAEFRLRHEATHDGLTQLANRKLFRTTLGEMITRSAASGGGFATLFIDLDLFKYVNDTYGHAAGDAVLIVVAKRLSALLGPHDLAARFGGDEFAVLLAPPSDLAKAESTARAIVASLAEPIPWERESINIGSSIGLALGPDDAVNAEELMRNADTAMYAAKKKGRSCYVIFDPEMQREAYHYAQLANDLQVALLDQKQIHLVYQPIVGLKKNEIVGFETLARWNHPVFGEIPAETFIRLAEQSGAMRNLGRFVLREACRQLTALSESIPMLTSVTLSVNISPSELSEPNFVESTVEVLSATDFDPKRLYLEITESSMVLNASQANRIISRLRDFGIRVSIDDFGAGYSSLRYLQELHVDLLKIDRGFLRAGEWKRSGSEILRAIVNLAAGFNLPVVAEGVETSEQLDFVRSIGCDYAQGLLWGKPLSIAGIKTRLSGKRVSAG
jgi:diguanylate cyclase (GGDEF)-like protein/PAS domain S-box-containing protein